MTETPAEDHAEADAIAADPRSEGESADAPANTSDDTDEISFGEIFKDLGPAAILATFWLAMPVLGSLVLFYYIRPISQWLGDNGSLGVAAYVGGFIVASGLGLLPTYAQAALGGFAFGAVEGTLAALGGFTGASLIGYAIARRVGENSVAETLAKHPRALAVRNELVGSRGFKTLLMVTLLRIPPNSPFSVTNLALASTGAPIWSYLLGTALGMLPRTAVVAWVGSRIADEFTREALGEARPGWLLPGGIALAVVVLLVLAQVGKKAIDRAVTNGEIRD